MLGSGFAPQAVDNKPPHQCLLIACEWPKKIEESWELVGMLNEPKVYVGNLSYSTTEESLRTFFSDCGEVKGVRLITDRDTGRSRGFAFVTLDSDASLDMAVKKNQQKLDGRPLRINKAEDRARRF